MSDLLLVPEKRFEKQIKATKEKDGVELSILNLGPTHPATHGIFQNILLMDGEKIIGVIMAGHDGRRGFIHHTAVLPQYRGRNIGKALVEHAMSALDKEGINKVALAAFQRNEVGNGFWEKLGFSVRDDLVYRNKNIHDLHRIDT